MLTCTLMALARFAVLGHMVSDRELKQWSNVSAPGINVCATTYASSDLVPIEMSRPVIRTLWMAFMGRPHLFSAKHGGRHLAALNRKHGDHGFKRPGATEQMALHRLRRTHAQVVDGVAPHCAQRLAFDDIADAGRGAVRVAMTDVARHQAR